MRDMERGCTLWFRGYLSNTRTSPVARVHKTLSHVSYGASTFQSMMDAIPGQQRCRDRVARLGFGCVSRQDIDRKAHVKCAIDVQRVFGAQSIGLCKSFKKKRLQTPLSIDGAGLGLMPKFA